ncbi:hypothetical protein QJQ45_012998 [Haematococcus lacustris]|nr:hypothetical protein QJQ45_012998 [Haematococcus lacustris]
MNQAFATVIDRCALVYLDDILIMSKSIQEHLSHLREIFSLLRKHKYFAKLSKCEFMKESLPFLGHIISKDGVAVDPSKVAAIKDWPVPTNLTALQSFLGMANYVTISDRGATFNNQFWIEVRKLIGVDPAFSTAYHPQSDGQTERTNQIVEEMLRHYILPTQIDWPRHLAFAEFAINNSWQESIQSTPFLVNYGQSPITPVLHKLPRPCLSPSAESFAKKWEHEVKHAQECMRVAQDRQQRYANKRRRDVTFSVGDSVLLSTKNLRNAPGKARKFLPRQVRFKKRMEYLVKWTGYDDTYNTWEPEAMLAGAPQILSRYKAVHNLP